MLQTQLITVVLISEIHNTLCYGAQYTHAMQKA